MPTKINWCDETWNPITGCSPISPGCANCYAKQMAQRLKGRYGYPVDDPFKPTPHRDKLGLPLLWKKPRRIFVCSMGDLFHNDVGVAYPAEVIAATTLCPQHRFLILTKRPTGMLMFFDWARYTEGGNENISEAREDMIFDERDPCDWDPEFPNLWLGTSCENQEYADKRIPHLLKIPAAVRWLSLEPLLSPIDIRKWLGPIFPKLCPPEEGILWTVIGCESGHGRRPCKIEWVHSIVEQCQAANVPVWVKQIEIDGKVETDMAKFPKELQVRELPK